LKSRKSKGKAANVSRRKRLSGVNDSSVMLFFLVFVVVVVVFLSNVNVPETSTKQDHIKLLNILVVDDASENGPAIVVGNNLDTDMLIEFANTDYNEFRRLAGITSEFLIYFEDDAGYLVEVTDKPCIGSSYAQVNGQACDE